MALPSGEQLTIELGDQQVTVVEVGGGLRAYTVSGRDVLDGYGADEMCSSGRGQVLIPWPNRLEDGRYEFDGATHQVPLSEPEASNAIHGLVRWVPWTVSEREPHRVSVEYVLHPRPGYPFALELRIGYELGERGLTVRTEATNLGSERCPFGAGAHPYLCVNLPQVDAALLQAPGATVLESDARALPVGKASVEGTDHDFRDERPIGKTRLDHAFTDLVRDDDGLARVSLREPGGTGVTLWMDDAYPFLMLYTGDSRPDVARRSIAVEPMTCPPNAFRSGEGLVVLDPGSSFVGMWGIAPE